MTDDHLQSDTNLSDDQVKLVRYSIVCIQRGRERVLRCRECKVFSDNMGACDFSAWVIADYIAELDRDGEAMTCGDKDLRVSYQVLGRWPRQDLHYEEKNLRRLAGIELAIRDLRVSLPPDEEPEAPEPEAPEPEAPEPEAPEPEAPEPEAPEPEAPEEPVKTDGLNAGARQVLEALAALGGKAAMSKLVRETGLSRSTLSRRLNHLIASGHVRRAGTGLRTRYRLVEK